MGQKIHPGGLRVGIIHDWKSNWFTEKDFASYLAEDNEIRSHIYTNLSHAGLSDIHIRKDKQRITIDIFTARPGIVIGKSGVEVEKLRERIRAMTGKAVQVYINEIKRPELDARLVAQSVAEQLENRVSFRRAMKRSLASAIRSGAQGVKIQCGGRLGGGEMSRSEKYSEGRVPLHTLRADIDYGFYEARTTFGRIGVKVWINKGEIMPAGYEGTQGQTTRLGEVDARRRRGGAKVTEDAGPQRPGDRRRGGGGPGGGGGAGGGGGGGGRGRGAGGGGGGGGGGRPGGGGAGGGGRPGGGGQGRGGGGPSQGRGSGGPPAAGPGAGSRGPRAARPPREQQTPPPEQATPTDAAPPEAPAPESTTQDGGEG